MAGQPALLSVEARGAKLAYQWRKDGVSIAGATGARLAIAETNESDSGAYDVVVTDGDGASVTSARGELTVRPRAMTRDRDPAPPAEATVWDARFAGRLAGGTTVVAFLALLPSLWAAWRLARGHAFAQFPALLAIQMFTVGVVLAAAAVVVVILELRGRSTVVESQARARSRGALDEAAKVLPDVLKSFGALSASAALLVVATAMFIGAAALAWRTLPDPATAGSEAGTTTSTTAPRGD